MQHDLFRWCEWIANPCMQFNSLWSTMNYISLKAFPKAFLSALTSLNPEYGTSAFSIQLELAILIALGILPWKGGKKNFWPGAPGLLISSPSKWCIGAQSLAERVLTGQPSPLWTAALTCSHLIVCLCVHEAVISMRKGVQRMDRGRIFFSWDGCRCGSGGHKGDLIHHVENSLELSPHVSEHQVITRFLTKVILGRETWGGPLKSHLSLLNKVHDASFKLLVDFYFCALLHYFGQESHEVWCLISTL